VIPAELLAAAGSGDRRALARAITSIEASPEVSQVDRDFSVPVIGITGPPGVGKSTLANALIKTLRADSRRVGIVAVDPSSPITGGALLGDRIRMQDHVGDSGVFIRSMASRGKLGGISDATRETAHLLTASDFDIVLVETVGVGQSEVDVMEVADVVVLVVAPGWGDQVQADKAGVVEVADMFVINKADRDDAAAVRRALNEVAGTGGRNRPVVETIATTGEGVAELLATIDSLVEESSN
jgi:LAO/AO transport system kinase